MSLVHPLGIDRAATAPRLSSFAAVLHHSNRRALRIGSACQQHAHRLSASAIHDCRSPSAPTEMAKSALAPCIINSVADLSSGWHADGLLVCASTPLVFRSIPPSLLLPSSIDCSAPAAADKFPKRHRAKRSTREVFACRFQTTLRSRHRSLPVRLPVPLQPVRALHTFSCRSPSESASSYWSPKAADLTWCCRRLSRAGWTRKSTYISSNAATMCFSVTFAGGWRLAWL